MIEKFVFDQRTGKPQEVRTIQEADWVNAIIPDFSELGELEKSLEIPIDFSKAALDEDESPRIEKEDGHVLILLKVPRPDALEGESSTIPISLILSKNKLVTVSLERIPFVEAVLAKYSRLAKKKRLLVIKILAAIGKEYNRYLDRIDKEVDHLEKDVQFALKNTEVKRLLKIQKELVYFNKALISNKKTLEKIESGRVFQLDSEDEEVLEDALIEVNQALDETAIYSNILSNTMDAYVSIVSNNINEVMKLLTIVTILLSIPTIFFNFYGMNVRLPLGDSPFASEAILLISGGFVLVAMYYFWKKKWV